MHITSRISTHRSCQTDPTWLAPQTCPAPTWVPFSFADTCPHLNLAPISWFYFLFSSSKSRLTNHSQCTNSRSPKHLAEKMKIFNWVHRKFNHNLIKDGFARNVKKTESIAIDTNTKALLEQVALVDVLDGWRDGFLTIGTFGFDPLKSFDQPKEYFIFESDEEEEGEGGEHDSVNNDDDDDHDQDDDNNNNNNIAEDEEEVNPLLFTTFEPNFEDMATSASANIGKTDIIITLDGVPLKSTELGFDIADTTEGDQGKKRRRTTLADLFSEDSDIYKKPNPNEFEPNSTTTTAGKKQSVRAKNGLSFAKKLIPHVKEDSRPIKKLNQMMRRMLKRKIHPELECKAAQKSECQNKATILELLGKKNEASESVSLLQVPVADIAAV
ncbi:hypothetical protein ACOSQ2_000788 [Xanthoceras sorbifolium]